MKFPLTSGGVLTFTGMKKYNPLGSLEEGPLPNGVSLNNTKSNGKVAQAGICKFPSNDRKKTILFYSKYSRNLGSTWPDQMQAIKTNSL